MKKALFSLFIGVAVLSSCQKEVTHTPTLHTLSYTMQGGSMYQTKSADDVLSIISSSLPQSISVVLKGQTNNRVFNVTTGQSQEIPSDTYGVTGTYIGSIIGKEISSKGAAILSSPSFHITNKTLTITDDVTEYTLPATYDCFAIACDKTLVESVAFTDAWGTSHTIPFATLNDTMVAFAHGDFDTNLLRLTITPKDTELYEVTELVISSTARTGAVTGEKGKWYSVSPTTRGEQPKWIALDLPTMVQGEF